MAASKSQRLLHLAHIPDLVPSDFFLFGYLNENLTDFNCETRDDLKTAISEMSNEINKEQSTAVFAS
jgi:hypothetical protein